MRGVIRGIESGHRKRPTTQRCEYLPSSLTFAFQSLVFNAPFPRRYVICDCSSAHPGYGNIVLLLDRFPSLSSLRNSGLNVLSCEGGWCTPGRQRRRWRSGRPSFQPESTLSVQLRLRSSVIRIFEGQKRDNRNLLTRYYARNSA